MRIRHTIIINYLVLVMVFMASCEGRVFNQEEPLTAAQAASSAGLEYLDQNKLAEAETEFLKLIELAPDEVMGYANLGLVYLRQGRLADAELYLMKALGLDEGNITVRLNLFDVYEQSDDQQKAVVQLRTVLQYDPENLFALYKMSEKSQMDPEGNSMTQLREYLARIINLTPTNIVPRIYLLEHLLENGEADAAMEQMEDITSKFEQLPEESRESFDQAYEHLRNSQLDQAYTSVLMFHNQVKLSNRYQADIRALKGSEDSRVGIPVISFSRKMIGFGSDKDHQIYQNIIFTEVAANAALSPVYEPQQSQLSSFVEVNDFDNDGDQDLLLGLSNAKSEQGLYLYSNELGRFQDVFEKSGLENSKQNQQVIFSDYNNDGFLDLLLINGGFVKLYLNIDELKYQDITASSGLQAVKNGTCALSFDSDHDGDLDLFIGTEGHDFLFQNDGVGNFTDITNQAGIEPHQGLTYEAVLGDFDDDGDIDFFAANENGNKLYSNTRMGTFEDVTVSRGLHNDLGSVSVSSGDFNNDGFLDLFVSSHGGAYKLYKNLGREGFEETTSLDGIISSQISNPKDHDFFDFDNDGYLDLILAGDPTAESGKGLVLLRNNQQQSFEVVSQILPENLKSVASLSIADYNEDSDLDVFVSFDDGSIGLLRNDGGNMNYQLKIQLVGLREGSGKNNYYGIGSKVEVRVGPIYQMRTISSPNEYFGLGSHERADILRIRWTNGVPQNIFSPHSDIDLIEQQKLKGSCPFLYAWNGERFVFIKDIMWRSALGMPLGIMTTDDTRSYAFSDASKEYLMVPGETLKARNGSYEIKITGELWETIYLDQLALYAVDHPSEIDFRLDEKFVPPPFPQLKLYPIKVKQLPVSVSDGQNDLFSRISEKDNKYIDNFRRSKYQGITELTDLIIDLGEEIDDDDLFLFLNGWIFPSDASINVAVSQSRSVTVIPPYLQVINQQGDWETVIDNLGFPMGKDKTVVANLSKIFKTKSRKLRIRTNMQIYWDHIFYSYMDEPFRGNITEMTNTGADLNYRGFSEEYRKGGRNGPHWFNYQQTTQEPKWMDLEGLYTRYGDVTSLLNGADNQYIIYNAGDEVTISYTAKDLPQLPDGWQRDFVIYSVGWVKDGDMNTAHGQTVHPLPYHSMPSYPYPDSHSYPFEELEWYNTEYNTRYVTGDSFRDAMKNGSQLPSP